MATLRQCPTLWTEIVAGRKCCEENLATFATFFPQQYNFSHFATFSSRNLQSKSSIHQKWIVPLCDKLLFCWSCYTCLISSFWIPVKKCCRGKSVSFKVFLGNFGEQTIKAKILYSFCFHSKLFIVTFIDCNFFWKMNPCNI